MPPGSRHSLFGLWLAFALVGLAACPAASGPDDFGEVYPAPDGAVWTGWPACDPYARVQTLSFVHVNDLHATFNPDGPGESPYARIRGYYEWVRLVSPYTVFTGGGDDHEKGALAEVLSGGRAVMDLEDAMGFDVRVLGNHDFAWGVPEVLDFSRAGDGLVLAANVQYTGDATPGFGAQAAGVLEIGCLEVGFFGLVSEPWNEQDEQFDGDFLPEMVTDNNVLPRAAALAAELRPQVDLVVMVSHLGLDLDRLVASQVPDIDVVLGGHSHTALSRVDQTGGALIVQSGAYARWISRLDLDVEVSTGRILAHRYRLLANTPGALPVSAALQARVEEVVARDAPETYEILGTAYTDGTEGGVARVAARAAVAVLGADAALVDRDTVWDLWGAGPVTGQDLLDAFKIERQVPGTPGWNSFYLATVTGAELDRLADERPQGLTLERPESVVADKRYVLALQKHIALRPARHLPQGVSPQEPVPALEAWDVLARYARARTARCLCLDVDVTLPDCGP